MRLLKLKDDGEFDQIEFIDNKIPRYAILSHTWGADGKEVTFKDISECTARSKAGYTKISFCREKAASHGLEYFWVDTCCIDKSSSAELQEAITSMFRWYQNAARCYVYLSDVSIGDCDLNGQFSQFGWESAFRASRWFTRGWTLQELLAPASVEFFSREGKRLGDKRALERKIYEITGIAVSALHGTPLSQFSMDERFSWAEKRQTTREEDWAYSLLGIFDISMPLMYGERREKAIIRLRKEIDEASKFAGLPSAEGAAFDSYANDLDTRCHPDTRIDLLRQIGEWAEHPAGKCIFWLSGVAGTGKSTISRTVAQSFANKGQLGASFFFKRGEGERGNASRFFTTIAVQLVRAVPEMVPFVRDAISMQPDIAAKSPQKQFEKLVLQPLSQINRGRTCGSPLLLVVDALDECEKDDIGNILHLLAQTQELTTVRIRVFLTSRPELPIRLGFGDMSTNAHQDVVLQDIPPDTIEHDISAFLKYKFAEIRSDYNRVSRRFLLPADWPGHESIQALTRMAVPLFIFAATICRFVGDRWKWNPNGRLTTVLEHQGTGKASQLDQTYLPVLKVGRTDFEMEELGQEFRKIIGSIILLADPLPTLSLARLLGISTEDVDGSLHFLHSVLSIPSDLNTPVRLLHLSFREFLIDGKKEEKKEFWFWVDKKKTHSMIVTRCLELLSAPKCLTENICQVDSPGTLRTEINPQTIEKCLPTDVRYACRYWVHHLEQSGDQIRDKDAVDIFLNKHLLHWLEALSLMGNISNSIGLLKTLYSLVDENVGVGVSGFLYDATRFILQNRWVIGHAPLQLYSSAIIFSPETSIVRTIFKGCVPKWICRLPKTPPSWSAELQKLEGHRSLVNAVAFSPDGKQLASASYDETVRLWDVATGDEVKKLEGHSNSVHAVAFSPDGKQLASASYDKTVRLWDAATGNEIKKLEGHSEYVTAVAFSPDGKQLASASFDETVRLWDAATGNEVKKLEGHSDSVTAVAFSPNGKQLTSASYDRTVRLWDAATGNEVEKLEGHSNSVTAVAFSPDGKQLASASGDKTVRLWDAATGNEVKKLEGHSTYVTAVAFSPDGKQLASASGDKTVRLWDAATGNEIKKLEGHSNSVTAVAFSPDGKQLASASYDETVRLWDAATGNEIKKLEGHSEYVTAVAFSPDGKQLASASYDETVRLWDAATGNEIKKLEGHSEYVTAVAFSPDGKQLASASGDETVRLWDAATGNEVKKLEGHSDSVTAVAFSPNGKQLTPASYDRTVRLWDAATGNEVEKLEGHSNSVTAVAFSPDGKQLASASGDKTVRLWDAATGNEVEKLEGHSNSVTAVAFSPDGKQLASASGDKTVRLWDAATGNEVEKLEGHSNSVTAVAFSPDGKQLASASGDKTVRRWDAATGNEVKKLEGHSYSVTAVAFSPDGKQLASASYDETVRLWDAATGNEIKKLEGHSEYVTAVAFLPDGKQLASASYDETVRLWDAATGNEIKKLEGHSEYVIAVAFSPDGKQLASASDDETVRLWDAATGNEVKKLEGHSSSVNAIAFPPDGKQLASASFDKTVRLWDATTGDKVKKIEGYNSISSLRFSSDSQRLETDLGIIALSGSSSSLQPLPRKPSENIFLKDEWIARDDQDLLWLPRDYRGLCSGLRGNLLAIGLLSGSVSFFEFT